jgi:signal transduction histidine kinase/pSer/pThr/pTyr-binding forkhead associated (FHA) protein
MPILTVIQGPDRGKTFEVNGAETFLGRDASCEVALHDPGISRHHATLLAEGDRYVLRDAGSANGTFVNAVRVTESPIQAGDQVRLGNTILAVGRAGGEGAVAPQPGMPVRVDTEGLVDVSITATETASGDPHLAFAGGQDLAEMQTSVTGLRALYRIADMLAQGLDTEALLRGILDMVFDVVDADRGAVLLKDEKTGVMVPTAVRYREELLDQIQREHGAAPPAREAAPKAPPICVSHTIINYVLKRGEGVLSTNAMQDRRFEEGESIQDYGIRSAICVPILRSRDEVLGILHIDTHVSQGQFTASDLKLMTAIGQQAGLAVANARLKARQAEQERLAAVGQTVASLSHSIKNILQGIQGGSHAIESGLERQSSETIGEGWDVVRRNLGRVNRLVLDMLSYGRQAPPRRQRSSVNAVVREAVELAQSGADEKHVTLVTDLGRDLPEVALDPEGIHHAVLNIVTNAIEAVPAVQGRVEVSTGLSPKGTEVRITVSDNGPGIPKDQQALIFQPFHSTKGQRGTGLGLAAAEKIVAEHKGRITVKSAPGKGAAFTIHLPRG